MPKLTKRFIDTLQIKDKPYFSWDEGLKGFGVRIWPSGKKVYYLRYINKAERKDCKIKIGVQGPITPDQARERAQELLGEIVKGLDPTREQKENKSAKTFQELVTAYFEHHGVKKRPRSLIDDRSMAKSVLLPRFGKTLVKNIDRQDIEQLHLKLKDTPYRANRVLALLSKMLSIAVNWKWRIDNPVLGIERYQEYKRERWLSDQELPRLLKALDQHPNQLIANAIRLLLLTGARKNEVLKATWEQFDLEEGVWVKPAHTTKQKKMAYLPLSPESLELLKEMREDSSSDFLFPGKNEGEPVKEIKRFWNSILKAAELKDFRIHDLRHTHASHLVSSGYSLSIVGKILGHTQAATTERYAHLAPSALREAASSFGEKFKSMLKTRPRLT